MQNPGNFKCNGGHGCMCCDEIWDDKKSFTSAQYGTEYKICSHYDCQSKHTVYCMQCDICGEQYIGSSEQELRTRLNEHRSSIKNNKDGCGTATHMNDVCTVFMEDEPQKLQCVRRGPRAGSRRVCERGRAEELAFADAELCRKERYWQAQLGTIFDGMNGTNDWYNCSDNQRNWRKEKVELFANVSSF